MPPLIIRNIIEFRRNYPRLGPGDLVLGRLALKWGEEVKLFDLVDRGVVFFPAALAQLLSRSKAAQAEVLGEFMVPGSFVAYVLPDLADRLGEFQAQGLSPVVAKRDRANLGLGVSWWPTLEALYSQATLQDIPYPVVVQPFLPRARDLRVVALGEYAEAYERVNPHSFRKNLFHGGSAQPAELTPRVRHFCRRAMTRGKFPYAVLDLLISGGGEVYLSEINLQGGLKGAQLTQEEFRRRVDALGEDFRGQWENS
jgi:ribosomal protein S6--L-glutamate ligase